MPQQKDAPATAARGTRRRTAPARPTEHISVPDGQSAVVLDEVGMTYTVRAAESLVRGQGAGARRRRASGMTTSTVEALRPLSLLVRRGESVGVIGTNGSGKSTLMKLITGQMQPTAGSVYATSTPIMLGVNAALVRQVSGEDNILLGCLAMGMSAATAAKKRDQIVELSGLDDTALSLPLKAYSSGMAARLQFAIATSVDPDILVIDEALNTGDAQFRERTRRRIDHLREQAGCVFLVSHSLGTIREMCTRVVWIERGELTMDGDPDEVVDAYRKYTIMLGRDRLKQARIHRQKCLEATALTRIDWADGHEPTGHTAP
ncbi:teichoic acid transport system ATP-binding protein [Micrococcus cohnii]|uniref:Teichoic acid transport system ATP-binding protein n=1 Tax=Micrococcus cohnii TaxID=993416 RepID=A0A7W7M2N9_9MICC|nr:ATP-binding cassette domain-containing protein [Micrococcus cohnii]MBB4735030.1 teichoic acid transport system ATP-binding protein [Micrococcus cohnii]